MRPVLVWLGVLAFVVGCASGAAAAEEGYVYTNADLLEMFGPPSPAPEPPAQPADGGWEMVIEFIDRQYERIDAERAHDLDRLAHGAVVGGGAFGFRQGHDDDFALGPDIERRGPHGGHAADRLRQRAHGGERRVHAIGLRDSHMQFVAGRILAADGADCISFFTQGVTD